MISFLFKVRQIAKMFSVLQNPSDLRSSLSSFVKVGPIWTDGPCSKGSILGRTYPFRSRSTGTFPWLGWLVALFQNRASLCNSLGWPGTLSVNSEIKG